MRGAQGWEPTRALTDELAGGSSAHQHCGEPRPGSRPKCHPQVVGHPPASWRVINQPRRRPPNRPAAAPEGSGQSVGPAGVPACCMDLASFALLHPGESNSAAFLCCSEWCGRGPPRMTAAFMGCLTAPFPRFGKPNRPKPPHTVGQPEMPAPPEPRRPQPNGPETTGQDPSPGSQRARLGWPCRGQRSREGEDGRPDIRPVRGGCRGARQLCCTVWAVQRYLPT